MKQTVADFLQWFTQFFAPDVQISPVDTASATTALQGQFSTASASTAIARRTNASEVTIDVVLRKSRASGAALDTTSLCTIYFDAGAGRTVSGFSASVGTVIASSVGAQNGWAVVVPNSTTARITVVATASGTSGTAAICLSHRTFITTNASISTV